MKRPIPGTEFAGRVIGTEEAWALEELPGTLAVVGAGASGTEIASAYVRLGVEGPAVRGPRPRAAGRGRGRQQGRRARLQEAGHRRAHQDVRHRRPERRRQGHVHLRRASRARPTGSSSPPAAGPDVEGLGLDGAGVDARRAGPDRRRRDACARTSRRSTRSATSSHGPALAHKASEEGVIAVEHAAGREPHPLDYPDIPRATFCQPNVGELRPDRGAGQGGRARRRRRQGPLRRRRARRPSTATAPAW